MIRDAVLTAALLVWAGALQAAETQSPLALHAQTTFIWQDKPAFAARYSGPNSLSPLREYGNSFTSTLDLGLRPWSGAELHFNPEAVLGRPLSNLTGSGGLSNGELARGAGARLTFYRARFFLRQRFGAGGPTETVEPDFNQLGGTVDARRWTLTVGNIALLDDFDPNPFAKDPRSQFFNWSFLTYGAWDYAADARGYSNGALLEYRAPGWALRAARVAQPRESNGLALDNALAVHYGDQVELESALPWKSAGGPLKLRVLAFRSRVRAGAFADALALPGTPSVAAVRRDQVKTGWGVTLEVPSGEAAGWFVRLSRNSGAQETYAFTEIDRQLAVGGQWSGAAWARPKDRAGVAVALNGLSAPHRDYLAAGGLGFFLGDGALAYGSERVLEAYYRYAMPEAAHGIQSAASIGLQRIVNPGYNRDRGPVTILSLRWHSEF